MTIAARELREAQSKPRSVGPFRLILAPVAMLVVIFYGALLLQQGARWLVAFLFNASVIEFHWGLGRLRTELEWVGFTTHLRDQWWWGPRLVAHGGMGETALNIFRIVGPALGALIVAILLWDLRRWDPTRGHNTMAYVTIAANLAAVGTTLAIIYLGG